MSRKEFKPEPGQFQLSDLRFRIESGTIKIPQFQRNFVWSPADSAKLLDSILKGYPIGTFTLWSTMERMRTVKEIGGLPLPQALPGEKVNYVLDGQQRMTSIYVCIKGSVVGKNDYSRIYLLLDADPDEEQIVTTNIKGREANEYISICDLYSAPFTKLLASHGELIDKIETYRKQLEAYPISTISLNDAPLGVATDIFTRINTTGKRLSPFQIMCAKMYDEDREFDLYEKREEQKERWENVCYDTVPETTILQAIAICVKGSCKQADILDLTKDEFIGIWDAVDTAFERAIDYFRTYYKIPVSKLLPYDGLLVPFVYYFYKLGKVTPELEHQPRLQDYFWRVVLTSRYGEGLTSKLTQDVAIIDAILNGESVTGLPAVNISAEAIKVNGGFSTQSAYATGFLCILASKHPQSFHNGAEVIIDNAWLSQSNAKNYHHFFPKAYMRNNFPTVDLDLVDHVANITIVDRHLNQVKIRDKAPSDYMAEFETNPTLAETMKTHLIEDLEGFGVYENNYTLFFQRRVEAYQKELRSRLIPIEGMDVLE